MLNLTHALETGSAHQELIQFYLTMINAAMHEIALHARYLSIQQDYFIQVHNESTIYGFVDDFTIT